MKIRPFTHADAGAALHIESWRDAYRGLLPDDYLVDGVAEDLNRQWQDARPRPCDVVLIAETDEVVGFIAVWCRPDAFIENLHVRPGVRSGGIGEALMAAAAGRLMDLGQSSAHLWVFEANARALGFYERLGGVRSACEVKTVHGNSLTSVKIVWNDLSVLAG